MAQTPYSGKIPSSGDSNPVRADEVKHDLLRTIQDVGPDLSVEELGEILGWVKEIIFDKKIEEDARSGMLGQLGDDAARLHESGGTCQI